MEGMKTFKKLGHLKIILFLLILSLLDTFSYSFLNLILKRSDLFILTAEKLQFVFIIIELMFIFFFYFNCCKTLNLKTSFFFIASLVITLIVAFITFKFLRPQSISLIILVFEVIFVNFFSGVFFVKNINFDKKQIQKHLQIINQSLFIFINLTAPYYFISNILSHEISNITITLNFINDFGYSFLFFQFIKAFKCLREKKN